MKQLTHTLTILLKHDDALEWIKCVPLSILQHPFDHLFCHKILTTVQIFNAAFFRKQEIKQSKSVNFSTISKELLSELSPSLQKAVSLAQEKGASSWLTALPVQEHGFSLHKTAFHDALALRYGWLPSHIPTQCACGTSFTIDHPLSYPKGGFPSIRHNEVRDLKNYLLLLFVN